LKTEDWSISNNP